MDNKQLSELYDSILDGGVTKVLEPDVPKFGVIETWNRKRQANKLLKSIGEEFLEARKRVEEAQQTGTVVNEAFELMHYYDNAKGIKEKTDVTFELLRRFAHHCEPAAAIIETRVQQVAPFAAPTQVKRGRSENAGFRIRMTDKDEPATSEDKKNMSSIQQFIIETGFTDPPVDERPINWQPGFESFIKQIVRDTLTLDWVAVRKWASAKNPKKYPIVSFAAVDAGMIRKSKRKLLAVVNHERRTADYDKERENTDKEIQYLKVNNTTYGGTVIEEYTSDEMFTAIRNLRTDENANGYGYSELERGMSAITIWLYSRENNDSRFKKDTLPRGFLAVVGEIDQQQLMSFQLQWRQLLQGLQSRWSVPILKMPTGQGAGVEWKGIDNSPREMEYHQFMFMVALWLHALYSIHPEETGFEALSPFRPPLSQGSPENKLKYSQEKGLSPLLRWIANIVNREIIWKLYPDRRYCLEFVGLGDYDEMQDTQTRLLRLQAGLSTPRMEWAELDLQLPDLMVDNVVWDLPMPLATGLQYIMQQEQLITQQEQIKQQMMESQIQQAEQLLQLQQNINGEESPEQSGTNGNQPQQGGGDEVSSEPSGGASQNEIAEGPTPEFQPQSSDATSIEQPF